METYFFNISVDIKQRNPEEDFGVKSENLIIELKYESNGDTSKITNIDILEQISKQLKRLK